MSHTPTPWFAVNVGTKDEPMWSVKAARITGQPPRHEVAICATGDSPQEMETANAAFIVRACNSFDDLVEALDGARAFIADELEQISPYDGASVIHSPTHERALAAIDATLSKARGETP